MRIAIIGSTGLVGTEMIRVLETSSMNIEELVPVASEKSVGKSILFRGKECQVVGLTAGVEAGVDVALFAAGSDVAKVWAPQFSAKDIYVVDNSSAFRMEAHVPLVVPEVNPDTITSESRIISNPNCSTIQLVVAIAPLHRRYRIKRLVVSTYQSVTGTGIKAVEQMYAERSGKTASMVYPHPIDLNCFPHGGSFLENGYTSEEQKLIDETRKILGDQTIKVSPTVVRIPVMGGHSEAVNLEFENDFSLTDVRELLCKAPGVVVQDDPMANVYPMPLTSQGRDEVFVGRIRRDESQPKSLNLWVVADNLRKGAATNAVQIVELMQRRTIIS